MQAVLQENPIANYYFDRVEEAFGERIGVFARIFGCWHRPLSRPFTSKKSSYRVCLDCGARCHFDPENLKTSGPFYYPPAATSLNT